jgi:hypothetical protein
VSGKDVILERGVKMKTGIRVETDHPKRRKSRLQGVSIEDLQVLERRAFRRLPRIVVM